MSTKWHDVRFNVVVVAMSSTSIRVQCLVHALMFSRGERGELCQFILKVTLK